jgi:hypothetical protein
MRKSLALALSLMLIFATAPLVAQNFPGASGNPSPLSRPGGIFYAPAFASQTMRVLVGNTSTTGSQTITIVGSTGGQGGLALPDGSVLQLQTIFNTLTPMIIDYGQSAAEYVTPTAVSVGPCPSGNLGVGSSAQCATFTGTFVNTHGQSAVVLEGTGGLQTALNYAQQLGGGQVTIDPAWAQMVSGIPSVTTGPASVNAIITGVVPMPLASIADYRASAPVFWSPLATQAATAYLAAPTTLTSSTVSSSTTVAGSASYTGGTIHACVEYVDIMGNEGPCSADYSFTDTSAMAIQFSAPAASAGAVGWIPFIGLESGSANNEYMVKLTTQPTLLGAAPISNGVCTLTTLETTTPACAIANSTYNEATSGTINVTAYPVVTSQLITTLAGVSTTSYYLANSEAHTTYAYAPGGHPGIPGIVTSYRPATVSAALGSTVPFVLGEVSMPPGFMNYQGRTIRVCGHVINAGTDADTITAIQTRWDAQGSNVTTGIPVLLGSVKVTATMSAATTKDFCQTITTTTASASATGGSLFPTDGYISESMSGAGTTPTTGPNIVTATVGSLNLALAARLELVYVETTGTADTPQLTNLIVTPVN